MVLTNVSVWKTFAMARDSCYDIDNTMKYTQTTAVSAGLKKGRISGLPVQDSRKHIKWIIFPI